jgi:transposase-like protein
VAKRQKRLTGVDEMVISLAAKGLTTGAICAHLAEVYGAEVSRQTISTITDKVIEGMVEWQNRPLDAGRFPMVRANPDPKDSRCRVGHGTRCRQGPNVVTSS